MPPLVGENERGRIVLDGHGEPGLDLEECLMGRRVVWGGGARVPEARRLWGGGACAEAGRARGRLQIVVVTEPSGA
eukprot:scaffold67487_cov21-Phaeocystis_antarctica.AAC.1